MQNIGGIANLTWLPAGGKAEDVIAFDCGPGNMLIDAFVAHFTKGRETFDRGGRRAAKGRVREDALRVMSAHPFLKRKWPRSCGREEFGIAFARGLLKRFAPKRIPADDWIATATRFTAVCIAKAYADVMKASARRGVGDRLDEVILCGGGHRNATLVRMLGEQLATMDGAARARIASTDDYGIPAQAKEGLSFAMLAVARMDGAPANLPQVTGAARGVPLGNVCVSGDR